MNKQPEYKQMPVVELAKMANPSNPRTIKPEQLDALKNSLESFDCVEPIVLNTRTNRIVGGHQRIKAALATEMQTLPVVLIDVDADAELAFNIGLNKVRGDWDYGKLAEVLSTMNPEDAELAGFSATEVEVICDQYGLDVDALEDEGLTQNYTNRTEDEAQTMMGAFTKVQLGMFSLTIPTDDYDKWVKQLEAESSNGNSPVALGVVAAGRLGIGA